MDEVAERHSGPRECQTARGCALAPPLGASLPKDSGPEGRRWTPSALTFIFGHGCFLKPAQAEAAPQRFPRALKAKGPPQLGSPRLTALLPVRFGLDTREVAGAFRSPFRQFATGGMTLFPIFRVISQSTPGKEAAKGLNPRSRFCSFRQICGSGMGAFEVSSLGPCPGALRATPTSRPIEIPIWLTCLQIRGSTFGS